MPRHPHPVLALSALLAATSGCDREPRPEPPAILRDVALIDDDVEFTQPYVPGHRTTMDGRIGIRVQGGQHPRRVDLARPRTGQPAHGRAGSARGVADRPLAAARPRRARQRRAPRPGASALSARGG